MHLNILAIIIHLNYINSRQTKAISDHNCHFFFPRLTPRNILKSHFWQIHCHVSITSVLNNVMISCEWLAWDGDSKAGKGNRAEKGENLVLHFLHVPHSRQLTFSTATLGWITTLKLRPFQRSTWNSHSTFKLFNYIILLISVWHAIKWTQSLSLPLSHISAS